MNDQLIPFNTVVNYDNGVLKGKGIVVGTSSTGLPVLGVGYIIKDISGNIPNSTFQYDTFVVHAVHLSA